MAFAKLTNLFVEMENICPNWQIYLCKFNIVFAQVANYLCLDLIVANMTEPSIDNDKDGGNDNYLVKNEPKKSGMGLG